MALGWLWWRAWFPVDAAVAAAVCMAGVALDDICLDFAWQVWHLATSTSTLRGSRGTYGTGLALVAWTPRSQRLFAWRAWHLATIDLHFVWQAWHLATSTYTLRGRCDNYGIWWGAWFPVDAAVAAAVCVAGVALGDYRPSLCVAGVALGDMDLHFAWQVWHLRHLVARNIFTHTITHTHTQLIHTQQLVHAQLVHTQLTH